MKRFFLATATTLLAAAVAFVVTLAPGSVPNARNPIAQAAPTTDEVKVSGGHGAAPNARNPIAQAALTTVQVKVSGGHGSGVIIGDDLILTARHVVKDLKGGDKLTVVFSDGSEVPAEVSAIWMGGGNDFATIRAHTTGYAKARMDCGRTSVGQPVLVFGHPLYLHNIATFGYVSGFSDDAELLKQVADPVILDVVVNPGNSGGPVFNMAGHVVGIAVAFVPSIVMPLGGAASSGLSIMLPNTVICRALGMH